MARVSSLENMRWKSEGYADDVTTWRQREEKQTVDGPEGWGKIMQLHSHYIEFEFYFCLSLCRKNPYCNLFYCEMQMCLSKTEAGRIVMLVPTAKVLLCFLSAIFALPQKYFLWNQWWDDLVLPGDLAIPSKSGTSEQTNREFLSFASVIL